MTCKNCLCDVFCSKHDKKRRVDTDEVCKYFKDKSRIIELPCKMGDTAWYISIERYIPLTYKIKEAEVINFRADCNGIFEFELKVEETIFLSLSEYVYFDKQKAEAKLKELKANEKNNS